MNEGGGHEAALDQVFGEKCLSCESILESMKTSQNPWEELDAAKSKLKELEAVLEQMELRAPAGGDEEKQAQKAEAKRCRKDYNRILKRIMKEENNVILLDTNQTPGFRRRSDMIFEAEQERRRREEEARLHGPPGQRRRGATGLIDDELEYSEWADEEVEHTVDDADSSSSRVQKRTFIAICAIVVLFVIAFFVYRHVRKKP